MACASELKPYFHNDDPWKKNWHFKYWNWPRCNQNSQILAKKSISQYGYLKHSKWAVLRNLSLISIITRIGEKKLGCLNTKNLWLATMLLFFICVFCSEVFWYYDTPSRAWHLCVSHSCVSPTLMCLPLLCVMLQDMAEDWMWRHPGDRQRQWQAAMQFDWPTASHYVRPPSSQILQHRSQWCYVINP